MIHKVTKNPFKMFVLWLAHWAESPFEREKREHEEACGRFVSGCVGIICTNSEPKCTRRAPQCGAEHPNNRAVFCTRKKDHEGPHIHCWSGWEPYIHNMHTWVDEVKVAEKESVSSSLGYSLCRVDNSYICSTCGRAFAMTLDMGEVVDEKFRIHMREKHPELEWEKPSL